MTPHLLAVTLSVLIAAGLPSRGADSAPAQIAELGAAYVDAFNKGDAKAVAGFWLPEGDYIDQFGNRTDGRAAIEKLFATYFAANPGAALTIESDSLKVAGSTAVEDGSSAVLAPGDPLPSRARFANTLTLRDGRWFLASVRESRMEAPDRSRELAPLSWLLGPWEAKTPSGESVFLKVSVAPGGNFLIAERALVAGGGPVAGGSEWIGWDPTTQEIRSWSFDADGGFGTSTWKAQNASWIVESTFTLRNGSALRQIQSLTLDDKGKVTVRFIGLSADAKDLPKPEDLTFIRPSIR